MSAPYEQPTFSEPATFLGAVSGNRDAAFTILGCPLDWATTNRAGTREGPNAIRTASRMLIDGGHPTLGVDLKALNISDLGNVPLLIGDIAQSHARIEAAASGLNHVCALGGDHSVALPLLRAAAKRHGSLGLVQFDAHADLWPENFGQTLAHGTPFYHAFEDGLIDAKRSVQIGIRSPIDAADLAFARETGITILSAEDAHMAGPQAIAAQILDVVGDGPTYLTFDIDGLDPAFAPGTGTPEVGGLHSWQTRAIMARLEDVAFVGMDVVEVSPPYDHAEITALAAATVVWDYLALQARKSAKAAT